MPVVEALACGTPVVHSAETAMDEISGDLGYEHRHSTMGHGGLSLRRGHCREGYADPALRVRRIGRAQEFDWVKSAEIVTDAPAH